jgi:hypothetical protein
MDLLTPDAGLAQTFPNPFQAVTVSGLLGLAPMP